MGNRSRQYHCRWWGEERPSGAGKRTKPQIRSAPLKTSSFNTYHSTPLEANCIYRTFKDDSPPPLLELLLKFCVCAGTTFFIVLVITSVRNGILYYQYTSSYSLCGVHAAMMELIHSHDRQRDSISSSITLTAKPTPNGHITVRHSILSVYERHHTIYNLFITYVINKLNYLN